MKFYNLFISEICISYKLFNDVLNLKLYNKNRRFIFFEHLKTRAETQNRIYFSRITIQE